MKIRAHFYSLMIFLIVQVSLAQDNPADMMYVDENTGLLTYKEVVEETGTKDELFNRCSSWLHTFYANPWEVAKVRDQASGIIKIEHQIRLYDTDENGIKKDAGLVLYNANVEFKDNRYRITVDKFVWKQASRYAVERWLDKEAPDYNVKWQDYLTQIETFVKDELVKSLKEKMKPPREKEEDDW